MTKPDPSLLKGVVASEVLEAMSLASGVLKTSGVRHVVVGALAVGANGFPRATDVVEFLIGNEAFERHVGGLVTFRVPVPFRLKGVPVKVNGPRSNEDFLEASLEAEPGSIIEAPALVYMKLKAGRLRDKTDVIEMIKAGLDVDACRVSLAANAPALVKELEAAVERARSEE